MSRSFVLTGASYVDQFVKKFLVWARVRFTNRHIHAIVRFPPGNAHGSGDLDLVPQDIVDR